MLKKYWFYIVSSLSIGALGSALIAEYIYGLQPCELCLKQRHPYYLFIIISLLIFFIPSLNKLITISLIQIGTIYGIFYSIWHVGVENKLLKGPASCSASLSISSNTSDLKEQILNRQVINCDEVVWSFFGISAASLNTMVLVFIFVMNGLYIYSYYGKKEKN